MSIKDIAFVLLGCFQMQWTDDQISGHSSKIHFGVTKSCKSLANTIRASSVGRMPSVNLIVNIYQEERNA